MIYEPIKKYCETLLSEFHNIPDQRKQILDKIVDYSRERIRRNEPVQFVYICTHNSRRSHFGQVWATIAAIYFKKEVTAYSGGTEATAFNINAMNALRRIGFQLNKSAETANPVYQLKFGEDEKLIECFSKVYDHPANPRTQFAAIMTCSDAEENCPFIPGVDFRIATTYEDPKVSDNMPYRDSTYDERCRQIAREVFYVFSKLN
ncbi:MAG TPA: protein-tyrosine-phosphatase [Bacteroidia bacterium]|jgi:protein-tyrosine phosphatase/arsenate reductase|nr:protein-tyrosine-phosphatase [Bacteroidia bacterium]